MRIIHGSGYSESDRANFKVTVYRNVIAAIQALVAAMKYLRISYASDAARSASVELESIPADALQTIDADTKSAIDCVWRDVGLQMCYQRRREYQISDSAK